MRTLIIGTATMAVLLFPYIAFSQLNCFQYAGGVISCDSRQGNTTIAPLGGNSGVITQHGHGRNSLQPYTIMPSQWDRYMEREQSSGRSDLDRPVYVPGEIGRGACGVVQTD
jgi:hypothetical protein